jgi:hypothetical protein
MDEIQAFLPASRALRGIKDASIDIYHHLVDEAFSFPAFTKVQREEECLKADLILKDRSWEEVLASAETHSYLKGKVRSVLDLARDDEEYSISHFKKYARIVCGLLDESILESDEYLLQRALLTHGDYLVDLGSHRFSFGLPNRRSYRERSENWLGVIEKTPFTDLVCSVEEDLEASLRRQIASVECAGWRELIVKYPTTISYCQNRVIHRSGEEVHLLTKSSFRGYHAELRTFVLCQRLQENAEPDTRGEIDRISYSPEYGSDANPGILVQLERGGVIRVGYHEGAYVAFEKQAYSAEHPDYLVDTLVSMPESVRAMLEDYVSPEEISHTE